MMKFGKIQFLLVLAAVLCGCAEKHGKSVAPVADEVFVPAFCADSAYRFVAEQVAFGPRVPNTVAHDACADYLVAQLSRLGARVFVQPADVLAFDGTRLRARNIVGSYNEQASSRVLLMAHWDSRPFSDKEPDVSARTQPILGADDGASGVGVLLEIARQLALHQQNVGVDVIFFDAEDYGDPNGGNSESWCLGSQYWARNPHKFNYRARYGILLDMVGARNATFFREGFSVNYASGLVDKVWNAAAALGYGDFFVGRQLGYITDDHLAVNELLGVPCIDIINFSESGFPAHWHTQKDNMDCIDKNTLKAVGQTVLQVVYNEK